MFNIMKNLFYICAGYIYNTHKDWILAVIIGFGLAWFAAQGF